MTAINARDSLALTTAKIILDGVKADRWRILVGDDAHALDERVRRAPEKAYTAEFYQSLAEEVGWRLGRPGYPRATRWRSRAGRRAGCAPCNRAGRRPACCRRNKNRLRRAC